MIDEKTVRHIAHLARIGVSKEEIVDLTHELAAILRFVETLSELDTSQAEMGASIPSIVNAVRDDVLPEHADDARLPQGLKEDLLQAQAPKQSDGEVRVPRILEG